MDVLENCHPVSGAYCTAVSDPTMRAAFYKLQVVGGHFLIQLNPSLAQISSFKELVTVGGELRIESNNVLHRIDCKQFLGCVTGLGICNPSTSSYALWRMVKELLWYCWCSGLFGFYLIVSWVWRQLIVTVSALLWLHAAFDKLQNVGGDLIIKENENLVEVLPFGALVTIGGTFRIQENENLLWIGGEKWSLVSYALTSKYAAVAALELLLSLHEKTAAIVACILHLIRRLY